MWARSWRTSWWSSPLCSRSDTRGILRCFPEDARSGHCPRRRTSGAAVTSPNSVLSSSSRNCINATFRSATRSFVTRGPRTTPRPARVVLLDRRPHVVGKGADHRLELPQLLGHAVRRRDRERHDPDVVLVGHGAGSPAGREEQRRVCAGLAEQRHPLGHARQGSGPADHRAAGEDRAERRPPGCALDGVAEVHVPRLGTRFARDDPFSAGAAVADRIPSGSSAPDSGLQAHSTSISVAPVIATSSSKVVLNTADGWPAAAQITSYFRSQESM